MKKIYLLGLTLLSLVLYSCGNINKETIKTEVNVNIALENDGNGFSSSRTIGVTYPDAVLDFAVSVYEYDSTNKNEGNFVKNLQPDLVSGATTFSGTLAYGDYIAKASASVTTEDRTYYYYGEEIFSVAEGNSTVFTIHYGKSKLNTGYFQGITLDFSTCESNFIQTDDLSTVIKDSTIPSAKLVPVKSSDNSDILLSIGADSESTSKVLLSLESPEIPSGFYYLQIVWPDSDNHAVSLELPDNLIEIADGDQLTAEINVINGKGYKNFYASNKGNDSYSGTTTDYEISVSGVFNFLQNNIVNSEWQYKYITVYMSEFPDIDMNQLKILGSPSDTYAYIDFEVIKESYTTTIEYKFNNLLTYTGTGENAEACISTYRDTVNIKVSNVTIKSLNLKDGASVTFPADNTYLNISNPIEITVDHPENYTEELIHPFAIVYRESESNEPLTFNFTYSDESKYTVKRVENNETYTYEINGETSTVTAPVDRYYLVSAGKDELILSNELESFELTSDYVKDNGVYEFASNEDTFKINATEYSDATYSWTINGNASTENSNALTIAPVTDGNLEIGLNIVTCLVSKNNEYSSKTFNFYLKEKISRMLIGDKSGTECYKVVSYNDFENEMSDPLFTGTPIDYTFDNTGNLYVTMNNKLVVYDYDTENKAYSTTARTLYSFPYQYRTGRFNRIDLSETNNYSGNLFYDFTNDILYVTADSNSSQMLFKISTPDTTLAGTENLDISTIETVTQYSMSYSDTNHLNYQDFVVINDYMYQIYYYYNTPECSLRTIKLNSDNTLTEKSTCELYSTLKMDKLNGGGGYNIMGSSYNRYSRINDITTDGTNIYLLITTNDENTSLLNSSKAYYYSQMGGLAKVNIKNAESPAVVSWSSTAEYYLLGYSYTNELLTSDEDDDNFYTTLDEYSYYKVFQPKDYTTNLAGPGKFITSDGSIVFTDCGWFGDTQLKSIRYINRVVTLQGTGKNTTLTMTNLNSIRPIGNITSYVDDYGEIDK